MCKYYFLFFVLSPTYALSQITISQSGSNNKQYNTFNLGEKKFSRTLSSPLLYMQLMSSIKNIPNRTKDRVTLVSHNDEETLNLSKQVLNYLQSIGFENINLTTGNIIMGLDKDLTQIFPIFSSDDNNNIEYNIFITPKPIL